MFGMRQFLKKENRTCPVCAIPYIREKRELKSSYLNVSYTITVWTLHCPECGYEVILPGIARIRVAENSKQDVDGSGDAMPPAVAITGAVIGGGEAGDKEPCISQTGNNMNYTGIVDRNSEYNVDTAGIGKGVNAATVADVQEDAHPVLGTDAGNQKTKTSGSPVPEADATWTGDAVPARDKANTADTADAVVPEEPTTEESCPDEKSVARSPEPEKTNGKEKTAGGAEKPQNDAGAAQERHKNMPDSRNPEGKGKDAAERTGGAGKSERRNKNRDIGSEAEPDRRSAPGNTPQGQGRKEQLQKGDDRSRKKQQAPHAAQGGSKPSMPDVRPAPGYGRPAAFPGIGSPGFPNSSLFPSTAISNLDMLRASIQAGTDNPSVEKKEGTRAADPVHESKETPAMDPVKSGGAGPSRVGSGGKPEFSADNKKSNEQKDGSKSLSAENRPGEPKHRMSADGSEKTKEKHVSTENTCAGSLDSRDGTVGASFSKTQEGGQKNSAIEADGKGESETPGLEKAKSTAKGTADIGQEDVGATEKPETEEPHSAEKAAEYAENGGDGETKEGQDGREIRKDPMEAAMAAAKKFQEKIPAGFTEKIPVLSQISKQQKRSLFVSEEKRYLEEHVPHKQAIINDLIYDTDNSEMFLRSEGQYGLDNPCVHYNYRTQNGNFFRCTVKYKHEDSIRVLDIIETKRMLEEYPDIYRKFFPDSVADA